MKFFVQIEEYERAPRGYGVCYFDMCLYKKVCCPMPFNWLVGAWNRILPMLAVPFFVRSIVKSHHRELRAAYERGYRDGMLDGGSVSAPQREQATSQPKTR